VRGPLRTAADRLHRSCRPSRRRRTADRPCRSPGVCGEGFTPPNPPKGTRLSRPNSLGVFGGDARRAEGVTGIAARFPQRASGYCPPGATASALRGPRASPAHRRQKARVRGVLLPQMRRREAGRRRPAHTKRSFGFGLYASCRSWGRPALSVAKGGRRPEGALSASEFQSKQQKRLCYSPVTMAG
jgi:hypothetical protein